MLALGLVSSREPRDGSHALCARRVWPLCVRTACVSRPGPGRSASPRWGGSELTGRQRSAGGRRRPLWDGETTVATRAARGRHSREHARRPEEARGTYGLVPPANVLLFQLLVFKSLAFFEEPGMTHAAIGLPVPGLSLPSRRMGRQSRGDLHPNSLPRGEVMPSGAPRPGRPPDSAETGGKTGPGTAAGVRPLRQSSKNAGSGQCALVVSGAPQGNPTRPPTRSRAGGLRVPDPTPRPWEQERLRRRVPGRCSAEGTRRAGPALSPASVGGLRGGQTREASQNRRLTSAVEGDSGRSGQLSQPGGVGILTPGGLGGRISPSSLGRDPRGARRRVWQRRGPRLPPWSHWGARLQLGIGRRTLTCRRRPNGTLST